MAAMSKTTNPTNPFLTNLSVIFRKNLFLSILITILHFTSVPLFLHCHNQINYLNRLQYFSETSVNRDQYLIYEVLSMLSVVSSIALFILLIVIFAKSFSYLWSKPHTDMEYSLPMNHVQRFFSNYLGHLLIWLPGAILAMLLSVSLYHEEAVTVPWVLVHLPLYELFAYHIIILSSHIAGTVHGALLTCGVLGVAYPFGSWLIAEYLLYAVNCIRNDSINNFLCLISGPIPTIISNSGNYDDSSALLITQTAFILIHSLICLAITYFLHRKRHAESAGKSFPHPVWYTIIQLILTLALSALAYIFIVENWNEPGTTFALTTAFIAVFSGLLLFDALGNFHTRNLKKRLLRIVVTTVIAVPIFLLPFRDNGAFFRQAPAIQNLECVSLDFFSGYNGAEIEVTDPALRKALHETHKEYLASPIAYTDAVEKERIPCDLSLTYKNGLNTSIYYLPTISSELVDAIMHSDAYIDELCKQMEHELNKNALYNLNYELNFGSIPDERLSKEEIAGIAEAYRKDLMEKHPYDPWRVDFGTIHGKYDSIKIPVNFTNTIEAIDAIAGHTDAIFKTYNISAIPYITEVPDASSKDETFRLTKEQYLTLRPHFMNGSERPAELKASVAFEPKNGADTIYYTLTPEGEQLLRKMFY